MKSAMSKGWGRRATVAGAIALGWLHYTHDASGAETAKPTSKEQLIAKTRAAFAEHTFRNPEPGAFSFMLSKNGYLNDEAAGPWLPHVMMFVPHGQADAWGAGLEGSPILGQEGSEIESTVLFIPVRRWSDGTAAPVPTPPHTHP